MSTPNVKAEDSDPARLFKLGADLALDSKFAEAVEKFGRVIQILPDLAEAYYARGLAHLENGALDEAMSDCTRAVELKPDHPWTLEGDGLYFGRPWKYYVTSAYAEQIAGLFEWDRYFMSGRRLPEPTRPRVNTYGFGVYARSEDGKVMYDATATMPADRFRPASREEVEAARIRVMGENSVETLQYCGRDDGFALAGSVPEALINDLRLTYEHTLLLTYYWQNWSATVQASAAEVALCRPMDEARAQIVLNELSDFGWLIPVANPRYSATVYEPVRVMTETLWPYLKGQWHRFLGRHGRMPELFMHAAGKQGGVAFPRSMLIDLEPDESDYG